MYAPQSQLLSLQIKKLITAAKLTQKIYGISRRPAVLDIFTNFIIVSRIKTQRMQISINPARGDLSPKNAADHSTFRINWTPKIESAFFTFSSSIPFCHIRNNEIPIIIKSVVHTGPNSQLGGANEGFMRVAYHVGIDGVVKTEPRTPAIRQIAILVINFVNPETLFIFI
jgi:hypothetical protein